MDRRRAAGALLALAACFACSAAAPTAGNHTALDVYDGSIEGCYYNFQHYGEGDRIMTNEPCLNCTCHNRMLMCYLRVCPFTKAIGQNCTVEKRADQCCPIVTCPDVPVDLLTSTSTSSPAEYGATGVGKLDKYGCSINGKYLPEGAKVPPTPNKPCEHCYCIRNMTTCVMQECTLHVDGCTPIYHKDVCCPVRYSCDHPEDEIPLLDDMTTTVRPTPGFILTTTTMSPVTQISQDCVHDDQVFSDGALIKTEKACEHCYCMKGDIVCVVQECGTPMENEGKNCTSLPPREGQCCPDTYICDGDEVGTEYPRDYTTNLAVEELTTLSPPRRVGVEGSGYRNEPDNNTPQTEQPFFTPEIEGSGEDKTNIYLESSSEMTIDDAQQIHVTKIEAITTELTPHATEKIPMKTETEDYEHEKPDKTNIPNYDTISTNYERFTTETITEENIKEIEHITTDKNVPVLTETAKPYSTESSKYYPEKEETSEPPKHAEQTTTTLGIEEKTTPLELIPEKLSTQGIPEKTIYEENSITTSTSSPIYEETEKLTPEKTVEETTLPDDKPELYPESPLTTPVYSYTPTLEEVEIEETEPEIQKVVTERLIEEFTTESLENIAGTDTNAPSIKDTTKPHADLDKGLEKEITETHEFIPVTTSVSMLEKEKTSTERDKEEAVTESETDEEKYVTQEHSTSMTHEEKYSTLDHEDKTTTEKISEPTSHPYTKETEASISDSELSTEPHKHITIAPTDSKFIETTNFTPEEKLHVQSTDSEGIDYITTIAPKVDILSTTSGTKFVDYATVADDLKEIQTPFADISDKVTTPEIKKDSSTETLLQDVISEITTLEPDKGLNTIPAGNIDEDIVTYIPQYPVSDTESIITKEKPTTTGSSPKKDEMEKHKLPITSTVSYIEKEFTSSTPESKHTTLLFSDNTDIYTGTALDHKSTSEYISETTLPTTEFEKDSGTTLSPKVTVLPEISTISQGENEIQEEVLTPGRIPGEGDCLLNGVTYRNESDVPSTDNCHTGCKCFSSIIKCDPIICSPPPDYMDNCQPTYDPPDACCPTYECTHISKETQPPQSQSHLSGTEAPIQHFECRGDQCEVTEDKVKPSQSDEICNNGACKTEFENKPEVSECGNQGCDHIGATSVPGDTKLGPSKDCTDNNCKSVETCTDGECHSTDIKSDQQCEGNNCVTKPDLLPIQVPQKCDNEEDCKDYNVPLTPIVSCEGNQCVNVENQKPLVETEPKITCKDDENCQKTDDHLLQECVGESCRRKDKPSKESKIPSKCSDSEQTQCIEQTESMSETPESHIIVNDTETPDKQILTETELKIDSTTIPSVEEHIGLTDIQITTSSIKEHTGEDKIKEEIQTTTQVAEEMEIHEKDTIVPQTVDITTEGTYHKDQEYTIETDNGKLGTVTYGSAITTEREKGVVTETYTTGLELVTGLPISAEQVTIAQGEIPLSPEDMVTKQVILDETTELFTRKEFDFGENERTTEHVIGTSQYSTSEKSYYTTEKSEMDESLSHAKVTTASSLREEEPLHLDKEVIDKYEDTKLTTESLEIITDTSTSDKLSEPEKLSTTKLPKKEYEKTTLQPEKYSTESDILETKLQEQHKEQTLSGTTSVIDAEEYVTGEPEISENGDEKLTTDISDSYVPELIVTTIVPEKSDDISKEPEPLVPDISYEIKTEKEYTVTESTNNQGNEDITAKVTESNNLEKEEVTKTTELFKTEWTTLSAIDTQKDVSTISVLDTFVTEEPVVTDKNYIETEKDTDKVGKPVDEVSTESQSVIPEKSTEYSLPPELEKVTEQDQIVSSEDQIKGLDVTTDTMLHQYTELASVTPEAITSENIEKVTKIPDSESHVTLTQSITKEIPTEMSISPEFETRQPPLSSEAIDEEQKVTKVPIITSATEQPKTDSLSEDKTTRAYDVTELPKSTESKVSGEPETVTSTTLRADSIAADIQTTPVASPEIPETITETKVTDLPDHAVMSTEQSSETNTQDSETIMPYLPESDTKSTLDTEQSYEIQTQIPELAPIKPDDYVTSLDIGNKEKIDTTLPTPTMTEKPKVGTSELKENKTKHDNILTDSTTDIDHGKEDIPSISSEPEAVTKETTVYLPETTESGITISEVVSEQVEVSDHKYSDITPDSIELEEHTHKLVDESSTIPYFNVEKDAVDTKMTEKIPAGIETTLQLGLTETTFPDKTEHEKDTTTHIKTEEESSFGQSTDTSFEGFETLRPSSEDKSSYPVSTDSVFDQSTITSLSSSEKVISPSGTSDKGFEETATTSSSILEEESSYDKATDKIIDESVTSSYPSREKEDSQFKITDKIPEESTTLSSFGYQEITTQVTERISHVSATTSQFGLEEDISQSETTKEYPAEIETSTKASLEIGTSYDTSDKILVEAVTSPQTDLKKEDSQDKTTSHVLEESAVTSHPTTDREISYGEPNDKILEQLTTTSHPGTKKETVYIEFTDQIVGQSPTTQLPDLKVETIHTDTSDNIYEDISTTPRSHLEEDNSYSDITDKILKDTETTLPPTSTDKTSPAKETTDKIQKDTTVPHIIETNIIETESPLSETYDNYVDITTTLHPSYDEETSHITTSKILKVEATSTQPIDEKEPNYPNTDDNILGETITTLQPKVQDETSRTETDEVFLKEITTALPSISEKETSHFETTDKTLDISKITTSSSSEEKTSQAESTEKIYKETVTTVRPSAEDESKYDDETVGKITEDYPSTTQSKLEESSQTELLDNILEETATTPRFNLEKETDHTDVTDKSLEKTETTTHPSFEEQPIQPEIVESTTDKTESTLTPSSKDKITHSESFDKLPENLTTTQQPKLQQESSQTESTATILEEIATTSTSLLVEVAGNAEITEKIKETVTTLRPESENKVDQAEISDEISEEHKTTSPPGFEDKTMTDKTTDVQPTDKILEVITTAHPDSTEDTIHVMTTAKTLEEIPTLRPIQEEKTTQTEVTVTTLKVTETTPHPSFEKDTSQAVTTDILKEIGTTPKFNAVEDETTQDILDQISTTTVSSFEQESDKDKIKKPKPISETVTERVTDEQTETVTKFDMPTKIDESSKTPVEELFEANLSTAAVEMTSQASILTETSSSSIPQEIDSKYVTESQEKEISTITPLRQPEKDMSYGILEGKPSEAPVPLETIISEKDTVATTTKITTTVSIEDYITTRAPEHLDKITKTEEKPTETSSSTIASELPKPSDIQPTDEIPSPEEESHFPPSGTSGYGGETDYGDEDQAFGPGTCRYGGKVYVSAQQIPRDDPCDFCFCFRSDIICLQQSCPPPIHGCHEEPIQGFCCPRYECPVSMATTLNVTTTTTTTTTTLPPHFPTHSYKGAAHRRGCQIKGHTYKVGEVVRASSGPCLHCTCGGDGQMKCDPKACTPEPMLRQMIAAAVSAKRRR